MREELLKFHDTWYSSNIMALAILGKESLDELEEMAVQLFSGVKDKSAVAPVWEEHPFKKEQLRTCAFMVPVKDIRNLNILFPSPDLHSFYKSGVSIRKKGVYYIRKYQLMLKKNISII